MSEFTVRVELHGATPQQYQTLHQRMMAAKFFTVIRGEASGLAGWYHMPTAEYDHSSLATARQVHAQVLAIANGVKPGGWVMVTQVADRVWNTQRISDTKRA